MGEMAGGRVRGRRAGRRRYQSRGAAAARLGDCV